MFVLRILLHPEARLAESFSLLCNACMCALQVFIAIPFGIHNAAVENGFSAHIKVEQQKYKTTNRMGKTEIFFFYRINQFYVSIIKYKLEI